MPEDRYGKIIRVLESFGGNLWAQWIPTDDSQFLHFMDDVKVTLSDIVRISERMPPVEPGPRGQWLYDLVHAEEEEARAWTPPPEAARRRPVQQPSEADRLRERAHARAAESEARQTARRGSPLMRGPVPESHPLRVSEEERARKEKWRRARHVRDAMDEETLAAEEAALRAEIARRIEAGEVTRH